MTLGELLKELRFNVLRDRSDLISGDNDSLWTDETLINYIRDAEKRFARQSLIIRDASTSAICTVTLKTGLTNYPLDKSVLSVISGRYQLDNYDLQRSGHSLLYQVSEPEFLNWNDVLNAAPTPGKPLAYYTDESLVWNGQNQVALSVFPAPSAAENGNVIRLRIIRLPTSCYDKKHLDQESEIPEDYQLDVLEWAAYRAQRTFDADAGAPTSAEAHKSAFDEAVVRAIRERKRMMFANEGMRYGMNGSRWTR